ncbi:MAG: NAD(P)-binding protein [Deltaproteobacteria bacterium]|nr:NAD(P)-binding protein [Deltaproteobacteria bacterium]
MEHLDFLVVGAGMSGLSFANSILNEAQENGKMKPSVLVIERDNEPGGYCKTIVQDGFTWDFSGHFFHFKHPEIEAWLRARMPGQDIRTVEKQTFIRWAASWIDFPFQKNIHQLPREDFIECLHDVYFAKAKLDAADGGKRSDSNGKQALASNFKEMLEERFGKAICERFLFPYNEKLYATPLDLLDKDAMGRFFPYADVDDIVKNMKEADNASYNQTFSYPKGGAIQYVNALLHDLDDDVVAYEEKLVSIDLSKKTATTNKREIQFGALISSAPFPRLMDICGLPYDDEVFSWNKVLCFNLGFDKKGKDDAHWLYFPQRELSFYRVGFYDNIMGTDRMSLYVELGAHRDDEFDVDAMREQVLLDLKKADILTDQELVSWHHVIMDPAYVHITQKSIALLEEKMPVLQAGGVYSVGRYGGWTYCSIEDNILETRALAKTLAQVLPNK